jgi:hypothetical protein
VLPALVVLVVVGVAAWLLGFGRTTASTVGVVLARVIAGLLLVVVLVAIAFTHIVGVLVVPLVGALLGAVWTTGSASGAGPPAGWYPDPEGGGQRYWSGPEAPTSQRSSVVIASKWDLVVPSSRRWNSGSLARSSSRTSMRVGSVTNTDSGSRTMPAT